MKWRRTTAMFGVLLSFVILIGGWNVLIGAAMEAAEPEDDVSGLEIEAALAPVEEPFGVLLSSGRVQGRINFAIPGMPWPEEFEMCSEISFDEEFYSTVLGFDRSALTDIAKGLLKVELPDPNPTAGASASSSASFQRESNDPCRPAQFYLDMIDAPRAWAVQTGDRNVVVAVIDTGIDPEHPDLRDNVVPGFNAIEEKCPWDDPNATYEDCSDHGTVVAGVIGAVGDNGVGIAGVAWRVSLMPVRVAKIFSATEEALIEGIRLAAEAGADVINISMSSTHNFPGYEEAIADAIARGAVVIAAVGNFEESPPGNPAAFEGVIGVGALAFAPVPIIDVLSAIGPGVDLVAPGEYILSTKLFGDYYRSTGTSMAAPIVSGVAALMIANGIPHDEVAEVLFRTAIWIGDPINNVIARETYGHGLVNAYAAVMRVDPQETILRVFTADGFPAGPITSPNEQRRYVLDGVPEGEALYLLAWIDVDRDGFLNQGDYVALKRFALDKGETLTVNLDLAVLDASISLDVDAPAVDLNGLAKLLYSKKTGKLSSYVRTFWEEHSALMEDDESHGRHTASHT